jgi:hypothetical protein
MIAPLSSGSAHEATVAEFEDTVPQIAGPDRVGVLYALATVVTSAKAVTTTLSVSFGSFGLA